MSFVKMYKREFICQHCGCTYIPMRSDQRFCSTSHRVANYQWRKRLKVSKTAKKETDVALGHLPEDSIPTESNLLLKNAGATALVNLVDHGLQKWGGVHNHDLKKEILKVSQNQINLHSKMDRIEARTLTLIKMIDELE